MSTAGPTIAGTGADGGGAVAWSNPGNITANDTTYAVAAVNNAAPTSNELLATNFGFALPAGAVVSSVQVDVSRMKT
jgi:hypothetical protein